MQHGLNLRSLKIKMSICFLIALYSHVAFAGDSITFQPKMEAYEGYASEILWKYHGHWFAAVVFSKERPKKIRFKYSQNGFSLKEGSFKIMYFNSSISDQVRYLYENISDEKWVKSCIHFREGNEVLRHNGFNKYYLNTVPCKFLAFKHLECVNDKDCLLLNRYLFYYSYHRRIGPEKIRTKNDLLIVTKFI
jgi:hypothetical protein